MKIKFSKIGFLIGLLLWLYDFDFFLNAGGPSTKISDPINKFLHTTNLGFPLIIFIPLLVLIVLGFLFGKIIDAIKNS
ncbi:hypothetical protein KW791_01515 [Candidatus Parcubacteria bacterium]|nr:hypothetical protein [Candidatus Parcubacteria bacterium]